MKVDISSKGLLTIMAENETEDFALGCWIKNNSIPGGVGIYFKDSRHQIIYRRDGDA